MRWLRLYLRSRRVPLALTVTAAAIGLVWVLWLTYSHSRTVNARTVSLTVMLAAAAFAATLSGADDTLDRTASVNWPVRRAGHVLFAAAVIVVLLLLTTVTPARFAPPALVLRNTAGLLGLTALGAALVGAARAWIAPLIWTFVALMPIAQPSAKRGEQVAYWLIQLPGSAVGAGCAAALAAAGLLAYARRGCPLPPATEIGTGA